MARVVAVDDPADPRLDDYRHLRDPTARRQIERQETAAGIFVAEGVAVIRRLLESRYRTRSLLVTEPRYEALRDAVADVDAEVYVAPIEVLSAVAGFDLHRGAVAIGERSPGRSWSEIVAGARTVAILEGLNDHENLGAIARSALGLGVGALLLDPTCADPLYRRSIRVSMGALLHLPFARIEPFPRALRRLSEVGFRVVALTPASTATPLDAVTRTPGDRVALLLGAEGPGLSADTLAEAEECVRIPLAPGADSLNVGHAAAIAFHHFALTLR